MNFVRNIRDLGRVSQVVNTLFRNGLGYVIANVGLKYHLPFTHQFKRHEMPTSLPSRVRRSMEDLGGAYVKLGQLLSLRPDLVPAEYCDEFRKLQDTARPLPFKTIKAAVEKELGRPLKEVFRTFDEEPLGSASIAQVHKASLKSGKIVVVKVQRPAVRKQFAADIDIMKYFADLLEKKGYRKHLAAKMIVKEFERYTRKELDLSVEKQNVKKFYDTFYQSKIVRIPKVYDEISTDRMLVLEYIEGKKLTKLPKRTYTKLSRNLIDLVAAQVLEMDIFHADLHPGNIMVLPDKRLGLLDFGIVGSLNPRLRRLGLEMLAGIIHRDPNTVYRALIKVGPSSQKTDYENFKADVQRIMHEWYEIHMPRAKITTMLHALFDSAQEHYIEIPASIVLLAKALVTIEGTCLYLDPNIDFRNEVTPRVEKLMRKKVRSKFTAKHLAESIASGRELAHEFSEETIQLIRRLKHGSFKVDVEDDDMNRLSISIDKSSNRMSYGMIIAALLISGTLMRDIPLTYRAIPIIPAIFFITAGFVGLLLAFSISKEGKEKMYQPIKARIGR